jgi:hypothetical protein
MGPIVDQLGPLGSLGWFARNMPRYERTLRRYGPVRTHLLAMTVSLANGCPYCAYGHALAFELSYFRAYDTPFQLDENELVALHGRDLAEIKEQLLPVLRASEASAEVDWVERLTELLGGAEPVGPDDRRLAHIAAMLGALNACAIANNTPRDQAHDPINKDAELKQRYTAARTR